MAFCREFTFLSSDGVHHSHAMEWLPDHDAPGAVVQMVHGLSDHIARYDHFARFLADHGFAVVGHDHLGHGKTAAGPEEYGFFAQQDGWHHVSRDVHTLRVQAGDAFPGLPYFLLGHSMGSFVARRYLIDFPGTVDGCILSGTGQEGALPIAFCRGLTSLFCKVRGPRYVSKLVAALSMGAYNHQFSPVRTSADWISRDQAVVDTYLKDPLCRFFPSVSMFHDMMCLLQYIATPKHLANMDPTTPVYLFSGEQDPVGACGRGVSKVHGFFQRAGTTDLSMKLYPAGRHEMLNELNRDEVYADVLVWLDAHLT